MLRFPLKKIRKQFKLLLLLVLLTFAVWFTYLHINQGKAIKLHFNYGKDGERQAEGTDASRKRDSRSSDGHRKSDDTSDSREEDAAEDELRADGTNSRDQSEIWKFLSQRHKKLPWKPEVRQVPTNFHSPLPTRTIVKKLAVAPKWKNYGLRIFGYIHPYKDGNNFPTLHTLSHTHSYKQNLQSYRLLTPLGSEWTAPGEFTKFRSQTSKSWRPFLPGLKYEVIDSAYISLYTDESNLKMNSVDHIPQTLASHSRVPGLAEAGSRHGADMLKPDPRDTFFKTPMIDPSRLENVLPSCLYSPTYVVKDFPIARYQGLQFVYLSFVYPNDFTRLTHMERENKCFYRESPIYLEKFGFYKYMKMDEEEDDRPFFFPNPDDFLEEEEGVDPEDEAEVVGTPATKRTTRPSQSSHTSSPSHRSTEKEEEVELRSPMLRREQRHFLHREESRWKEEGPEDPDGQDEGAEEKESQNENVVHGRSLSWIRKDPEVPRRGTKLSRSALLFPQKTSLVALTSRAKQILTNSAHAGRSTGRNHGRNDGRNDGNSRPGNNKDRKKEDNKIYITRPRSGKEKKNPASRQPREVFPGVFLYQNGKTTKLVNLSSKPKSNKRVQLLARPPLRESKAFPLSSNSSRQGAVHRASSRAALLSHTEKMGGKWAAQDQDDPHPPTRGSTTYRPPPPPTLPSFNSSENALPTEPPRVTSYLRTSEITESQPQQGEAEPELEEEEGGLSEYSYEEVEPRPGWAEEAINWQRTFSVNSMDFETLRSDWNDLRCNVSGNLQLSESEVVDVLAQYMEKLNERNGGIYTLLRIINVEKRRDSARGNRYLIELELMERGRSVVRLSEYVYLLLHRGRLEDSLETSDGLTASPPSAPQTPSAPSSTQPRATSQWGTVYAKPLLCQPVMLQWKRDVMVHFVVPVKNQARWVQQFISDMELLHHETKDENFNIIIVDFQSDDMDIEQALRQSSVPRYDYLRREGNFERSAGLQIGVDTIEDSHSIVFLCDLHIHFPLNILESIRKHCVEGRLAFAPIVMRLGCGSSPLEPDGYWEVNGFGLFGIYKSDFDKIGGMNTEEFKDRWGGEDWELLDRVLQNGLEVERLRLRNFFHYYHSKRGMWNSQTKKSPKG
uniref:Hexosyltransferase n=1 Tax=Astyanax mexicanus TaxID=7994 RepID=A0A8B9J7R6_ASTMX